MSEPKNIEALVEQVVTALVDDPDSVRVESVQEGSSTVINVHVNSDDVGKVIGRQGRIIKSLRTIARAASSYSGGKHVEVEVLE